MELITLAVLKRQQYHHLGCIIGGLMGPNPSK